MGLRMKRQWNGTQHDDELVWCTFVHARESGAHSGNALANKQQWASCRYGEAQCTFHVHRKLIARLPTLHMSDVRSPESVHISAPATAEIISKIYDKTKALAPKQVGAATTAKPPGT